MILWFIEHHPDSEFHRELHARIFGQTDWLMDPAGYAAARKPWLDHAAKPDVNAETLRNAASFLDVEDKPLAEQLLRQGQRMYGGAIWSERLGRLYTAAIVGQNRFMLGNVLGSSDPDSARSAYAAKVRATLDTSTDATVLTSTAGCLSRIGLLSDETGLRELARTYVIHALEIDPKSEQARYRLDYMEGLVRFQQQAKLFANVPIESRSHIIAKLPDDDRLVLPRCSTFPSKHD